MMFNQPIKWFNQIIVVLFFVLISLKVNAQADSTRIEENKKTSFFQFKNNYLSNAVYNGRKDSATLSYTTPAIFYNHKSGLNIGIAASYTSQYNRIDVTELLVGYSKQFGEKFTTEFNAARSFYNSESVAVQGNTSSYISAEATYESNFLNYNFGGELLFDDNTDYLTHFTLSKPFYVGVSKKDTFSISPTIKTNAGTQDFYSSVSARRVNRKVQKQNVKLKAITEKTSGSNAFDVLDYEFSLPVNYETKQWSFGLTPVFSVPVNPITTVTKTSFYKGNVLQTIPPPRTDVETEDLTNSFYVEIEVCFKLFTKHNKHL